MLVTELSRVNELDNKIADLHHHLAELYDQRVNLLGTSFTQPAKALPKPSKIDVRDSYTGLQTIWESLGAHFPTYKALEKHLETACATVRQLEHDNPSLLGKVSIVAVPPFKSLIQVLAGPLPEPVEEDSRFKLDVDSFESVTKAKNWSLLVVIDPDFSLPIYGLISFLERGEYLYNGHDCRGLGLAELLAAELQGVETVQAASWTVLLKDRPDGENVVSATLNDSGQIIFQAEDSDCLLGENYLRLAISIK